MDSVMDRNIDDGPLACKEEVESRGNGRSCCEEQGA